MSGQMFSTSSCHSRFIHRDNSTIGVSNKSSIGSITSSIDSWGDTGIDTAIDATISNTMTSQVVCTSSSNSGLINGSDSTIGVGNQGEVSSKRTSIPGGVGEGRGHSSHWSSSNQRSSSYRSSSKVGNCGYRSNGTVSSILGSKVVSTSSSNSWLINGSDSTIGVGNQGKDSCKRSGVAIASSIREGSGISSGIRITGISNTSISNMAKLGGKVLSFGSSHSGLIDGGDSTIGVTLES